MSHETLDARMMLAQQHIDDLRLQARRDRLVRTTRKQRSRRRAGARTLLHPATAR